MAINTLATATLFMTQLDKIAIQEATTGWMDANAGQVIYNGGSEVKIPKMNVGGYMKNVKDQVYAALCTVFENVSDAYPRSWAEGSTIQYTEEQNDVYEASSEAEGMREDKALVRYRIDIWNNHSTSEAALQVDEAMKVTGLKRIACADVPDPSGMKHKQMRYEGIIDMDSDSVYWR